ALLFLISGFAVPLFLSDTAPAESYTLSLHDALPISALKLEVPPTVSAAVWVIAPAALAVRLPVTPSVLLNASAPPDDVTLALPRTVDATSALTSRSDVVVRIPPDDKAPKVDGWFWVT